MLEDRLVRTEVSTKGDRKPPVPIHGKAITVKGEDGKERQAYQFLMFVDELDAGLTTLEGGKTKDGKIREGKVTGITPQFLPFPTHTGKAHIAPSARWMTLKAY